MVNSSQEAPNLKSWQLIAENKFEVGKEDLLQSLRADFHEEPSEEGARKRCQSKWDEFVKETRIKFGTILKADTVSVLLGAGASKHLGGVLLGSIPLSIEQKLLETGIRGVRVSRWLRLFYTAAQRIATDKGSVPTDRSSILERRNALSVNPPPEELNVNLETLLSVLYGWRATLSFGASRMRLDGDPSVDASSDDVEGAIQHIKAGLVEKCILPDGGNSASNPLRTHRELLKKLLTRPLNLKRVNIFTLNYDTLIEKAADAEGIVVFDGFVGTLSRVFRPESYDQDLYFPAETTEGRVHRFDRVVHLYKLHGSISWQPTDPDLDNPYGIFSTEAGARPSNSALIYPTPLKQTQALGMPYAELFRRLAATVVRPQSVLLVIGYGFGDEHVVSIFRQALAVPSFRLIVVDPRPRSGFIAQLRSQNDQRVWIVSGPRLATFEGFVDELLPDLREEEMLKKVMDTWRALSRTNVGQQTQGPEEDDGK